MSATISNSTAFNASIAMTTSYVQLSALLNTAGFADILNNPTLAVPVTFVNEDSSITIDIAAGYTAAPSGSIAPLLKLGSITYGAGLNTNEVWVKAASGTPNLTVAVGALHTNSPTISGFSTVTVTNNTVPKGDSGGNLVDSDITDDGSLITLGVTTAVTTEIKPVTNDGAPLGDTTHNFSDLFLATGAVLNYNNGNVAVTHSSGILTMGTGELRITTPGTNAASVPTLGSTNTFTNKTLTSPVIATGLTASGSASNDFSGSTGTFKTSSGVNTLSGAVTAVGQITAAAGTTSIVPLNLPAGTLKTTPAAGDEEFDGASFYGTVDATSGRGAIPSQNYQRLTSNGSTISTIANFFGATSNISLVASAFYEIDIYAWFLKTTAGTATWTLTNSAAPTSQNIYYEMSPITGVVAPPGTATMLVGQVVNDTTATLALTATGTLTTAVNHYMRMKIWLQNGTGTSLKIQATASAGTITPLVGSYYTARRLPASSVGSFAA